MDNLEFLGTEYYSKALCIPEYFISDELMRLRVTIRKGRVTFWTSCLDCAKKKKPSEMDKP